MSRALAVESRLPEPGTFDDALLPPLVVAWGAHATAVREFLVQPGADGRAATEAVATLLEVK